MGKDQVQQFVISELGKTSDPISVSDLLTRIRSTYAEAVSTPDFDFRAAVVALTAHGTLDMDTNSRVSLAHVPAQAPVRA